METEVAIADLPEEIKDDGQPYRLDKTHFFSVDKKFFLNDGARDFDLFIQRDEQFLLYRGRDVPFTIDDREKLEHSGVKKIFILNKERDKYLQYIEETMMTTFVDPSIPVEERSRVLYDMSTSVISDLLADPESKRHIGRSKKLVEGISGMIDQAPSVILSLFSQKQMAAYVITHCINVCIFGIGLARRMDISDPKDIEAIGVGCLLHDVGKQAIPERIVNKPGKLSEQEWMIMKRHPELGVKICKKSDELPEDALIPILQHHEKLDGTGYPQRLKGDQIHRFGRIAAVADTFDALTSDTPYSKAVDAFSALQEMKKTGQGKIDPDVFRELVMLLKGEVQ